MPPESATLATLPALFHAGLRLAFDCQDLDQASEQMLFWGVELQQLGRGRFRSAVQAVHSPRVQLSTGYRSLGVLVRGSIPRGAITLSSIVRQEAPQYLQGALIGPRDLMCVHSDRELDFRTVGFNEMVTVSIQADLFHRVAEAMFGSGLAVNRRAERLTLTRGAGREVLNYRLRALLAEGYADPGRLLHPETAARWELRVVDSLLAQVEAGSRSANRTLRRRAALEAEAYLRGSTQRIVTIGELCLEIGVPKRTLMLGFQDAFGMSPIAYHKRLRLNQARRDLLRSSRGDITVAQVALRWGFEHFGRFSIDYRQMFEESPAETLRG